MTKKSNDSPKLAIVILSFNVKDDLLDCLASIMKSKTTFRYEIIVVDNNSNDDSVASIRKEFPKVTVLESATNLGYTGGNNLGIKEALKSGCEQILILNPDTLLSSNLLEDLVEACEKDPKIGIASPKIYFAAGYEYHDRYRKSELGKVFWYAGGTFDKKNALASHLGVDEVDHGQYDRQIEVDFVSGCAMLVKREVFEKIGYFDDKYFLYLEDLEYSWRAKMNNFKLVYFPIAAVWHKNAQSSQVGSILQDYYITRNRLLFASKYLPVRTRLALFREAIRFILTNQTKRDAVFDYWQGRLGRKDFR